MISTVNEAVRLEDSVMKKLPAAARPFVAHLIAQGKAASASLESDPNIGTLRELAADFSYQFFDIEKYPGVRPFVDAAHASPDCTL